ncbi:MAG: hypothetical protein IT376_06160 [Polyangiaceae bacterium]|nr:hypothetical protein [Polyangiaceae bacterium]
MTNPPRRPHADAHRRASDDFRSLSPEQQRERMRAAGVLGVTPQLGDKVRVVGRLDTWRYGIIVGADQAGHGRVHVAHDDGAGIVVEALDVFAAGRRVELIQRARPGREYEVAAHVMGRRGQRFDVSTFDVETVGAPPAPAPQPSVGLALLGGLLAGAGLAALAVALSEDREWDESVGRYRDARGKFAAG